MAGKSQVATRGRDDDLNVIGEGWREERGLLEDGVISAEPDMVAVRFFASMIVGPIGYRPIPGIFLLLLLLLGQ